VSAGDDGSLLEVKDLRVYFRIMKGTVKAVDGVSFALRRGQTMGLVGESGCGKTTTAYAITRLLPKNGEIVGGEIRFNNMLVGRAHVATGVNEALKRTTWFEEVHHILNAQEAEIGERLRAFAAAEARLLQTPEDGRGPLEAEVKFLREAVEARAHEAEFIQALRAVIAAHPASEELKEALQEAVGEDLKGWTAARMRRRMDREMEAEINTIRWSQVSMIFQSAMNALNPVYRVGDQIAEALLTHFPDMTKDQARERVLQLFDLVGIDRSRADGYPHEFSGGMRQRSMIAMALACNPQLLIADEPTTALDVIMQDRILAEIRDLQRELNIAMIIITHDISVVAEVAEKIGIMYGGKLFEYGNISEVFERPGNPYTIGLMSAFPSIKGDRRRLRAIPGSPPDLSDPPSGCRFHPRCRFAQEVCRVQEPPMVEIATDHWSLCHFAKEIYEGTMKES
jgi:peptide/nickel transport system ATP-binding protein